MSLRRRSSAVSCRGERGSVIIIVMWTCLGLVALTLYFANSMSSELRAADNRVTEIEARQAVAGGIRYAGYVLTNYGASGAMPNIADYKAEALPVGEAQFWMLGRDYGQSGSVTTQLATDPVYGLIDEGSKLNINRATRAMLMELPNMTDDLADAIINWRRAANGQSADGAGGSDSDNIYARLDPPRRNKGGAFETVDELRLVDGATLDLLLGEDTNRNGVLDANEDDGEQSAPRDNQDGQLQAGLLEFLTVYTRLPTTRSDGTARRNVTTPQGRQQLIQLMVGKGIDQPRAAGIVARVNAFVQGNNNQEITSVAEFMIRGQITPEDFALIHTDIVAGTGNALVGLVNVNTASATVLACLPGVGQDYAATLVAYRQSHPDALTSFAWLREVLPANVIIRAGPYITDQSYQFTADIAAVGHFGRGYCREKVVFDMRNRTPRIVFHQDLSSYGWALGTQVRQTLKGVQ